jgi:hypothetical protein
MSFFSVLSCASTHFYWKFHPPANVLLIFWFYNSVGTAIRLQTLNFFFLFTCRCNVLFFVPNNHIYIEIFYYLS